MEKGSWVPRHRTRDQRIVGTNPTYLCHPFLLKERKHIIIKREMKYTIFILTLLYNVPIVLLLPLFEQYTRDLLKTNYCPAVPVLRVYTNETLT
jgi:hypothetical protein